MDLTKRTQMETVRIQTIIFKNKIADEEVSLFRGAVIHAFEKDTNILFHNHQDHKWRYSYPLIQYKRINGYASIVSLNEGSDAIGDFFSRGNFTCRLGGRRINMEIASIKSEEQSIQLDDAMLRYQIQSWLPLNSENYQTYKTIERLVDRISMLENILIGNILSFNKGINNHIKSRIICRITKLDSPQSVIYKGVELMAFNAEFKVNMPLPDFIGLGKCASISNGMITKT